MEEPDHAGPVFVPERLIHYGPLWDERLEAARKANEGPVAVLVCHGMGQQVRYETIDLLPFGRFLLAPVIERTPTIKNFWRRSGECTL
jgi:hypothetical protein